MVCENINSSHKLKIDYSSKNLNKSRNLILKLLFLEIICLGLLRLATLRQLGVSRALSIIKNHPKVLLISLASEFTVFRRIFRDTKFVYTVTHCITSTFWFHFFLKVNFPKRFLYHIFREFWSSWVIFNHF